MKSKLSRLAVTERKLSMDPDYGDLPPTKYLVKMIEITVLSSSDQPGFDPQVDNFFRGLVNRLQEGAVPRDEIAMWTRVLDQRLIPAWIEQMKGAVHKLGPNIAGKMPACLRPPFELPPHIRNELARRSKGSANETSVSFPSGSDHSVIVPKFERP